MNTNNTPEADKAERMAYSGEYMVPTEVARKLERERDEAQTEIQRLRYESQRESEHHDKMVGELEKVYAERDEWAAMCGQYKQERDDAREEIVLLKKTPLRKRCQELESALRRLLTADIPRPLGGIIDDDKRQAAIEWNAFERGEARQHAKAIL